MPASYHDGGNHDGAVLHASGVVWKQRRVLDQHQFVGVVPVADLQGKTKYETVNTNLLSTPAACVNTIRDVRTQQWSSEPGIPAFLTQMQRLVYLAWF